MKRWPWLIGMTVATVIASQAAVAQVQIATEYVKRVSFTPSATKAPCAQTLPDLVYSGKRGVNTVKTELPYTNLVELNRDISDASRLHYTDQVFLADKKITMRGTFERSTHQNSGEYSYDAQGTTCRGHFAITDH
jgi:hypothetical protein